MNFLTFSIQPKQSRAKAIILVAIVLAICLFPTWPWIVKVIVFYCSYYFLLFTLAFSVIRLIVYYIARLVGFELWILPEIYDNVGFKESFCPVVSCKRLSDGWLGILVRVLLALATIAYVVYLYRNPGVIVDVAEAGRKANEDAMQWSLHKLAFNFTSSSNRTLTYIKEDSDDAIDGHDKAGEYGKTDIDN